MAALSFSIVVFISSMFPLQDAASLASNAVVDRVQVAWVSGPKHGTGFDALHQSFLAQLPGYDVVLGAGNDGRELAFPARHAVSFVQNGSGTVRFGEGEPLDVRVGDLIIHRPGESCSVGKGVETVSFLFPESQTIDAAIPNLIKPDFDPGLTDRPGGCATDPGAYRRLLLTWNPERGPYVHHGFNCHRVRIDDSFSHYHPVDGGFDEFYLVQEAPVGATLLISHQTRALLSDAVQREDVASVIERIPLEAGQLIMIPRGVTHRGLGGAVVQVLAMPGFLAGKEIPMDASIKRVNDRFVLSGARALPTHE